MAADKTKFAQNLNTFGTNVYEQLVKLNPSQNIIFSPISIQTCAAMVRMGAEKNTAEELDRGLQLSSKNISEIADSFAPVLAAYKNSKILKIANKVYIRAGHKVKENFDNLLTNKFQSKPEQINFAASEAASKTINTWVESKTNNLIKNLISPNDLDGNTRLVLVNAVHFKGEWKTKFDASDTRDDDFFLNDADKIKMPMMNMQNRFAYGELADLDAKALSMPYSDSDLSMLIILPNKNTGLQQLESKLKSTSLLDITKKLSQEKVRVMFPKFRAEFAQELTPVFQKLGMNRLFSGEAEFGQILDSGEGLTVSKIIHKAFIDVNEEGTEAAAATGVAVMARSMPPPESRPKEFYANKPFYYIIYNNYGSLFMGKLASAGATAKATNSKKCACNVKK